ncbi:retinol dehydrogenase 13 [Genypterus blacodes]|uniref:retinol dehydrogenase 13 n=1 Tax=Genypterus blacodes TaxID=154954 RepID=UPI003F7664CA
MRRNLRSARASNMQNYTETMRNFVQNNATGLTVALVSGAGLLAFRRWMGGGLCRSKARLDGKTVLITGANTGIGKETALDMARRGARVILACRDMTRARIAADDIRQQTGNGNVVVKNLDLASLQSVRDLAKDITENEERLDILINNAGIMMCPKWTTQDGFEMQFGVNHLGHFLLTNCLLDLLKKSAPSRVVIVSSLAHERGSIHFDDINLDKDYKREISYRQSKLANVLFCRELASRLEGTGVTVYSLHPGVIYTELGRHLYPTLPLWKRIAAYPFLLFIKTPWQGAQTTIYCAVDESLANVSGLYYSDCAPKTAAPKALDDVSAKALWDLSASMVGLA